MCPTKPSVLDPLPTSLMKVSIDILALILATIINTVSRVRHSARYSQTCVTLLKKPNMDLDHGFVFCFKVAGASHSSTTSQASRQQGIIGYFIKFIRTT